MSKALIIVGIAGASGSGKSSFATNIVNEIGSGRVDVISEDSYYRDIQHLEKADRENYNYDHPDAFEHQLLINHVAALRRGEPVNVPIYDYIINGRSNKIRRVEGCSIIVLEGILLFADEKLRDMMDIKIYIDTPLDLCILRRIQRDIVERGTTIDSCIDQYRNTTRPMFMQFIEPSKRYADILVPHGGKNIVAIDIIKTKLEKMLQAGYDHS